MAEEKEEEKEFPCPGETFVDKMGGLHRLEWHEKDDCKFCKGRGRQREVGGYKEVDRYGNPVVDFCCHQCKNNYRNETSKINNAIRTTAG